MSIKKVPLKRRNANNPQIKSYVEAVKSGQKSYHVIAKDSGLQVRQFGKISKTKTFSTKKEAIAQAAITARRQKSEIIIHKKSGLIEKRVPCKK